MTNEEIIKDLDSDSLRTRGVNAIEALFAQLKAKDKYIAELESIIANKKDEDEFWSPGGFMKAKQVSKYLGYPYNRIVDMGHRNILKMKKEGKSLVFFKEDVIEYKRRLEEKEG